MQFNINLFFFFFLYHAQNVEQSILCSNNNINAVFSNLQFVLPLMIMSAINVLLMVHKLVYLLMKKKKNDNKLQNQVLLWLFASSF